jgi:hypothetical protein
VSTLKSRRALTSSDDLVKDYGEDEGEEWVSLKRSLRVADPRQIWGLRIDPIEGLNPPIRSQAETEGIGVH